MSATASKISDTADRNDWSRHETESAQDADFRRGDARVFVTFAAAGGVDVAYNMVRVDRARPGADGWDIRAELGRYDRDKRATVLEWLGEMSAGTPGGTSR
jgi:hypothetical protein